MTNLDNLVIDWQISRNQNSATQLFDLVGSVKFAIIRKYAKTELAATEYESLANTAFVDAISTFDFSVRFTTYFVLVLKRRIRDWWRKKRIDASELSTNFVVVAPNRNDISEYCAILSPIQAKVIHLTFVEGKTVREIADEIGVNYATVSRMNKKALEQLREALS